MKINGNEIRPGNTILHQNHLWRAVKVDAVKPGKGPAYAQVELKNLIDGRKLNERFRSSETVERVRLEQKDHTFLYAEGDMLTFMDSETYEQVQIPEDMIGDQRAFLQDGMAVSVEMHEGRPIGVALPEQVTLSITETEPTVKGQTASSSYKPAVLENGLRVMVPPHISADTAIIVNTETLEYVKRAD
jgi:elongation factor P